MRYTVNVSIEFNDEDDAFSADDVQQLGLEFIREELAAGDLDKVKVTLTPIYDPKVDGGGMPCLNQMHDDDDEPTTFRCQLPAGHAGVHSNGSGEVTWQNLNDEL